MLVRLVWLGHGWVCKNSLVSLLPYIQELGHESAVRKMNDANLV